jgi:hypothetical protein
MLHEATKLPLKRLRGPRCWLTIPGPVATIISILTKRAFFDMVR